eukprot:TRINITY_DN8261_c0_g1_i1.p1 TRINITY_DN8261_c0_g1~~TRINITY_DN8261_c0_g1_i1.p1  ORF type:complete len:446 (+),score=63.63 TRINITY_DN8261_c0_g1_i1:57-1340(+)
MNVVLLSALAITPRCQDMANRWCNSDTRCSNALHNTTDLLARNSTSEKGPTSQWRCYAPSTLSPDKSHYVTGEDYCTRDVELSSLLSECEKSPATDYSEVFTPFEAGYPCIRIPSLVQIEPTNRLIALAECRNSTGDGCYPTTPTGVVVSENSNRDLCVKYSDDEGQTWSAVSVIQTAAEQPTAVFSPLYKKVFLHYLSRTDGAVYQKTSTDGVSWSQSEKVNVPGSEVGPGPGLSMADGTLAFIGHAGAYQHDNVWYGGPEASNYTFSVNSSETLLKMDEASLTQLPSGIIMANMRNDHETACKCRAISLSHDKGATWSPLQFDDVLIDPVNQGSIITLPSGDVLFSNAGSTTERVNGTISVGIESSPGSVTWNDRLLVWSGAFAYSCLTSLSAPKSVGLLWETNGPQCASLNSASCRTVYSKFSI